MGFWLLVAGVGMGGAPSADTAVFICMGSESAVVSEAVGTIAEPSAVATAVASDATGTIYC